MRLTLCSLAGGNILRVSELLATKLVENEFTAYLQLYALMPSQNTLSTRGFTIASYVLCGFANIGTLGIQIGVLSALAHPPDSGTRLPQLLEPLVHNLSSGNIVAQYATRCMLSVEPPKGHQIIR
jgi:nucleoside permease NupC